MIRVRNWLQSLAGRTPRPLRRFVARYFTPKFLLPDRDAQARQGKKQKREQRKHRHKEQQDQASRNLRLAQQLAQAMWAGFGACAAEELEAIESNGGQPARAIAEASRALSRWYAFIGEHERALRSFRVRRLASPLLQDDVRQLALETETLLRLDHFDEAKALVQQAIGRLGELPELCFSAANAPACGDDLPQFDKDRLRWRG